MPQILIHLGIGYGDGHAAGEGDHHKGRKTHQCDENEEHEENRHGFDQFRLVQNGKLRHVFPVRSELGAVWVGIVDGVIAPFLQRLWVIEVRPLLLQL